VQRSNVPTFNRYKVADRTNLRYGEEECAALDE
jgi:hypothetical protein